MILSGIQAGRLLDSRLKRAGMTPHGASATAEQLPLTTDDRSLMTDD